MPDGYIALASQTYTGFVILRSNLKSGSDTDIAKAVAYGKRIKFYPLSQAANPPETKFVDAILVDPADPKDLQQVHALQDAVKVSQKSPGKFEVLDWGPVSQKKVRDALLALAGTLPDTNRMFGSRGKVDPVRRLIGAASAWGGNPEKDATYLNFVPAKNDGTTVHRLIVKSVPVDGCWSISVYNAQGYYEPNKLNAYTISSVTGKKAADGSIAVQFGGCDGEIPNCLPIVKGWNYMVRLYRPRAEILSGQWKFPEAKPAA